MEYKHLSFSSLVFSLFLLWFDFVGRNLAKTLMNCRKLTVSLLLKHKIHQLAFDKITPARANTWNHKRTGNLCSLERTNSW